MPPLRVSRTRVCLMCVYDLRSAPPGFFSDVFGLLVCVCRIGLVCSTELNYKFGRLIYLITGLSFHPFLIIPRMLAAGNEM